ncbi:hypothetical protein C8R43DRAFT_945354 [Mycena crocata]|nr:hypothetical protein C8R43DRAFT_945354 [Mycena crocata]
MSFFLTSSRMILPTYSEAGTVFTVFQHTGKTFDVDAEGSLIRPARILPGPGWVSDRFQRAPAASSDILLNVGGPLVQATLLKEFTGVLLPQIHGFNARLLQWRQCNLYFALLLCYGYTGKAQCVTMWVTLLGNGRDQASFPALRHPSKSLPIIPDDGPAVGIHGLC